jgi:hypothetical protein
MPATRWEQTKKAFVIGVVILLIVVPLLALSPVGPNLVKDHIDEQNPPDQPVKPWATERMYKLGRFYSLTLRDGKAKDVYHELIFQWYAKELEEREIDRKDPWVGMALYHYATILWNTRHKQDGAKYYVLFTKRWEDVPGVDPMLIDLARKRVMSSRYSRHIAP